MRHPIHIVIDALLVGHEVKMEGRRIVLAEDDSGKLRLSESAVEQLKALKEKPPYRSQADVIEVLLFQECDGKEDLPQRKTDDPARSRARK